jgi:site-specific DNA recombinase
MSTAIYARVSTETQEKQQTIESQLAELRRYAQAQGLTIDREFIDDGYSGTVLERPGLDALRDCASRRHAGAPAEGDTLRRPLAA